MHEFSQKYFLRQSREIRVKRLFIVFSICVSTVSVGGFSNAEEVDLTQQAKQVLEKYCYACHGRTNSNSGNMDYILDQSRLVSEAKISPGKPDDSRIYIRITSDVDPMPPSDEDPMQHPRPKKREIEVIRKWIEAMKNIDDNTRTPLTTSAKKDLDAEFVSTADVLKFIRSFLESCPPEERKSKRFLTLTHLHNLQRYGKVRPIDMTYYRAAVSKSINSLSWSAEIVVPIPIDDQATVLAIDLDDLDWDDSRHWMTLAREYPYGLKYDRIPEGNALRETARQIYEMTQC